MNRNIIDGFYAALPPKILKGNMFEIIPVFVGQGKKEQLRDAVNKLLYFDQVDIVSGIINYRGAAEVLQIIEKSNALGFFMDMGENIPTLLQVSEKSFFNSFQLWQSEYALGYWAHKEFGDKGLVAMSVYDAGYHLQSAFRQGAIDAGSTEIDYTVLHADPQTSQVTPNIDEFFQKVKKASPSFIHAIFCGTEALEFLEAYSYSEFKNKTPLLVTAHMAEDEILNKANALGLKLYAASMYNYDADTELNRSFKKAYTNATGQKANIFALLGYEMGTVLKDLHPNLLRKDWKTITSTLKEQTVKSARGIRSFYHGSENSVPVIDIEKIEFNGLHTINKIIVNQGKALQFNNRAFDEINRENVTGWLNPYLCV
jgi:branched-chain amino acid transport system substrate-binding protein